MLDFNPFGKIFNIKAYTKWYHYFWLMPLMCIMFGGYLIVFYLINWSVELFDFMKSKLSKKKK